MQISTLDIGRLRDYSSLFSGQTCESALRHNSVSAIKKVFQKHDSHLSGNISVWDYLKYIYRILEKEYRSEYVVKNTFINSYLLEKNALDSTVVFNEFRVGNAVADLVLMNGVSKAFEIKSELDSDARIVSQLSEYCQLFEECYIVIPKSQYKHYSKKVEKNIGIVLFEMKDGTYIVKQKRKAKRNPKVSIDILMRSVRCDEYKQMVLNAFGKLPNVNSFDMYDACYDKLKTLSSRKLHSLFIEIVKKRKNLTEQLPLFPREARQMYLSLPVNGKQILKLNELYNNIISI